ncbi:hypothetical protein P20439_2042 [Pseudoalteromonas sp. BSi20439]|nr:hypothetical protein P20439_2042 [Pseudoalteromonas sp. BSi20439]
MGDQTALCAYIHENERRAHIVLFNFIQRFRKLSDSNTLAYLIKLYYAEK